MLRSIGSRRWLIAAALSAATVTGCKNGVSIPIWNPFAKPAAPSGLVQSGEHEYVQPSMPKSTEAEGSTSWSSPFKKLGETLSSPFKEDAAATSSSSRSSHNDSISLATKNSAPQPGLYVEIAKVHERAGKLSEAVGEYDKALDLDAKYQPALLGLARLYDRLGRYDEALSFYSRATTNAADDAALQNDYGLCLSRSGNAKDSVAVLRRAVSLDPKKILYRNNLATVLVELGRPDEAYQTLVAVHGESVAHYNVGFLLAKYGRKSEALVHFEQSARLDPSLKEAQQWVAAISGKPATTAASVATPSPAANTTAAVTTSNPPVMAMPAAVPRQVESVAALNTKPDAIISDALPQPAAVLPRVETPTPSVPPVSRSFLPEAKPAVAPQPQPAAAVPPTIRNEESPRPAAPKIEERYPVTTPPQAVAPKPAAPVGVMPPLPEQISNLDVPGAKKSVSATAAQANTAAAKYPPSRY